MVNEQRYSTPDQDAKNASGKSSNRKITVYLPLDDPPENAKEIGHITIGDTGFTTNCGQTTVILQAKSRAKAMGGDAVHIYEQQSPNIISTCYRIKAKVLSLQRGESTGTAFFVNNNGMMLTANHVIDGAKKIVVQCPGENETEAWLLKQSKNTDLAVITTKKPSKYYLPMGRNSDISLGKEVFTIGYPVIGILGKDAKYTEGNISSATGFQNEQSLMQISVPVQPGNSGGPVVSEDGKVLGVVVSSAAIKAFYGATNTLPQNINWAAKIGYAQLLLDAQPKSEPAIRNVIEHAQKATCLVTTN
ncbi:serine protease [Gammaproteobacteria bacterium]|nr:serine protease [Gammaproteobacteria bacterium]